MKCETNAQMNKQIYIRVTWAIHLRECNRLETILKECNKLKNEFASSYFFSFSSDVI